MLITAKFSDRYQGGFKNTKDVLNKTFLLLRFLKQTQIEENKI